MPKSTKIPKEEMPSFIRRCWDVWRVANTRQREKYRERMRFYSGQQWREEEIQARRKTNRPFITINQCKPAVDQIEGDIRRNPPGPQVRPMGDGASQQAADIFEGLIREVEYRCHARDEYVLSGRYLGITGESYLEEYTEYVDELSTRQRLGIRAVKDPETVFRDPDGWWIGTIKRYNRDEYISNFGDKTRVMQGSGMWDRVSGWMRDAFVQKGWDGEQATILEWTGDGRKGPFYVAEFYQRELDGLAVSRAYTDGHRRFDADVEKFGLPPAVEVAPVEDVREVPKFKVCKYVTDALEILDEGEWLGSTLPIKPICGQEVFIEGQRYVFSVISEALDSQRGLNYAATTAGELAGAMNKSAFIGVRGSFTDPKWNVANYEVFPYIEHEAVLIPDEATGRSILAPPPQRNSWEAPIQWLIALASYFSASIKATTGIYEASLGQHKGDQSGVAIEQLRSESANGTFSYADTLHSTVGQVYQDMIEIFPKLMTDQQVVAIVKPNDEHEMVTINKMFPGGVIPEGEDPNDIRVGVYGVTVKASRAFEDDQDEATQLLTELFKASPILSQNPQILALYISMLGNGNPKMDAISDVLVPKQDGNISKDQLMAQMQKMGLENQQLKQALQQAAMEVKTKMPELKAKQNIAALDNLTKLNVAEINASKDVHMQQADNEARQLEQQLGIAHEAIQSGRDRAMNQQNAEADRAQSDEQQMRDHALSLQQMEQQRQADAEAAKGEE